MKNRLWEIACFLLVCIFTSAVSSCTTGEVVGTTIGTTAALGRMPTHDIEQIYYLGVFDPMEQVPPSLYRVIVRGQASAISAVKYASGWVPAEIADSLSTRIRFDDKTGDLELRSTDGLPSTKLKTGRGMIMFGPEGFREAPRDHRLVIVTGSNPSAYFDAVDSVLGEMGKAQQRQHVSVNQQNNNLMTALIETLQEQDKLTSLKSNLVIAEEGK